ncbi:MAG TPA: hypothetical protein PK299_11580 [Anaerolineales bacterium]|nr:hypothetical protein [Anaerolineales bacterium]
MSVSSRRSFAWLGWLIVLLLLVGAIVAMVVWGLPYLNQQILQPIQQNQAELAQLQQQLSAERTEQAAVRSTANARSAQMEVSADSIRDQLLSLETLLNETKTQLAEIDQALKSESAVRDESDGDLQSALTELTQQLGQLEKQLSGEFANLQSETNGQLATLQPVQTEMAQYLRYLQTEMTLLSAENARQQGDLELGRENLGNARLSYQASADWLERLVLSMSELSADESFGLITRLAQTRTQIAENPALASEQLALLIVELNQKTIAPASEFALPTLAVRTAIPTPLATQTPLATPTPSPTATVPETPFPTATTTVVRSTPTPRAVSPTPNSTAVKTKAATPTP